MSKTYIYRARDHNGNIVKGILNADSKQQVIDYIHEKNCYINSIEEQHEILSITKWFSLINSIRSKEIVIFCRQLAIMINCGLPLITAIKVLIEQSNNRHFRKILNDIYRNLEQGKTLAESMERHDKVFPQIMIYMIKAGELGGVLDEVLNRLSVHLENDYKIKEKVKTAMIYPTFIIILSMIMVVVIMIFVMPVFITIFSSINVELPLPTQILLLVSSYFQKFYWLFFIVMAGGVFLGTKIYNISKYKISIDRMLLKIPLLGVLSMKASVARFARTLGTLLKGGIPLITALATVKNVLGNSFLQQSLNRVEQNVKDGFNLSDTLLKEMIFEPMVIHMIAVGEETGQLDILLHKIAEFYENDVADMVARLNSLLEPMIILFLGVVIGSIIIAVALPMFDSIIYSIG